MKNQENMIPTKKHKIPVNDSKEKEIYELFDI